MTAQNENDQHLEGTPEATSHATAESEPEVPASHSEDDSSCVKEHCADDTSHSAQPSRARSLLASAFSALVLISIFTIGAVGAGAYFAIHTISQHGDNVVVRVLIQDEVIELKERQLDEFNASVERAVLEKHEAAHADIESEVHTRIDDLFEKSEANITEFVDWYYSMAGSVLRFAAWTQDGGAEFVSNQFADQVLDGGALERDMHLVYSGAKQRFDGLEDDVARQVNQELLTRFDARPAESVNGSDDAGPEVHVTDAVREAVRFSNTQDLERWGFSASTTGAAIATWGSGVVAARVIAHSPRISAAVARTGQSIARLAGQRMGAAAVRGATTAAATAWTGPTAPFVGAGVTVTTLVGTEYAVLQHQRGTEGREMEENLRVGLVEVRDQIKREITQEYRERIDRRVALLNSRLVDQAVRVDDKGDFYVFGTRAN